VTNLSMAEFRANMASYCDKVGDAHEPLHVTRGTKKKGVVVMSEEDFASWQETIYLLRSPKNALRLLQSIEAIENGEFQERELAG
jgi:antitoxin YefM